MADKSSKQPKKDKGTGTVDPSQGVVYVLPEFGVSVRALNVRDAVKKGKEKAKKEKNQ